MNTGRQTAKSYYIMSVDVGRIGCQSVAVYLSVATNKGAAIKNVVNIYTYDEEHFGIQAVKLKDCITIYAESNGNRWRWSRYRID